MTNAQGRSLYFRYDADGFLIQVTDPAGAAVDFRYVTNQSPGFPATNSGLLQFVDRADGSTREYRYDEAAHVPANFAYFNLLTGIVDERAQRYGTYKYNTQGRAYQEYHGSGADLLTLTYNGTYTSATGSTILVTPSGQVERRRFIANNGILRDAGTDHCATANCSSITRSSNITYDTNGNRDLVTDFNGVTTDYGYNTRGQETSRVEASNTSGTGSPKRTIETQWHTDFRVPVSRKTKNASGAVEAKTTWAYNPRGQATARCELDPADAPAMSYPCSATSAPPAGAKVRRTVTTYCEPADVTAGTCPLVGLVRSVNGPRPASDTGMTAGQDDLTTYTYYLTDDATCASNGACPHRKGDLWKATNALGQVTTYVTYDKNGRVTRTQDANGTYTDFAYHVRGWLTDRSVRANATPGVGDATTHLDYDAVGNVTKVTQPDGAFLAYTYDDAHRLIKIADNQNNTIDYCPGGLGSAQCLDAAGNRRVEQVKDPSGTIKRALSRSYNPLSQLVRLNNAAGTAVELSQGLSATGVADGYDGNGNRVLQQDGLGVTTKQRYDGLNRLVETIQNLAGVDTATANTTTGYVYDTRDNLRQV
ncbi:MAG: RHS repeat protein, partial [Dokdonella sp.]|nr:RHS repeat protein [Dokdonella sp.]